MFAGSSSLNGGIECQKVGLLGQVVNYFNDFSDIVCAASEHVDNFSRRLNCMARAIQALGCLFHRHHAGLHFVARAV
jgi:hypothetical protein